MASRPTGRAAAGADLHGGDGADANLADLVEQLELVQTRVEAAGAIVRSVMRACSQLCIFWRELVAQGHMPSKRRVLAAVFGYDELSQGRAAQATLRDKVLQRLHARPPTFSSRNCRAYRAIRAEVECTRGAFDQLVALTNITVDEDLASRSRRVLFSVFFDSASSALAVCGVSASLRSSLLSRSFKRRSSELVTRVLVEHYECPSGRVFYVLDRHPEQRKVLVAVRANEDYDLARLRPRYPLERLLVDESTLPGLPVRFEALLSWRASATSSRSEVDPLLVSGKLSFCVPISVVEGAGRDVAALVS